MIGPAVDGDRPALVALLREAVEHGASVGFVLPVDDAALDAHWVAALADPDRVVLVARDGGEVVGTVQLALVSKPNGRHRAEVQKLAVRRSTRGGGWGRRLMAAAEDEAGRRGVRLLVLDTSEGEAGAAGFYEALGWTFAGRIPDYALDPDGTPNATTLWFRLLA